MDRGTINKKCAYLSCSNEWACNGKNCNVNENSCYCFAHLTNNGTNFNKEDIRFFRCDKWRFSYDVSILNILITCYPSKEKEILLKLVVNNL